MQYKLAIEHEWLDIKKLDFATDMFMFTIMRIISSKNA